MEGLEWNLRNWKVILGKYIFKTIHSYLDDMPSSLR